MADAILFNGAAAFIGQEAGIVDLVIKHKGLNPSNVKFVGGLSSGSVMTFSFNVAFSENPAITWDQFKNDYLFTMTSDKVYERNTSSIFPPYLTGPFRRFLDDLTSKANLDVITDLPFESAILVTSKYFKNWTDKLKVYWLTNIEKVASVLPSETDTTNLVIAKNIKDHQLNIKLVSALMSSTAIKNAFPQQELAYKDNSGGEFSILNSINSPAKFIDGGFSDDPIVFANYKEFFTAYGEHFENLFLISPDNLSATIIALDKIHAVASGTTIQDTVPRDFIIETLVAMENTTRNFIKDLKNYNSDGHLADKIYYCTPHLDFSDPLDFDNEREQYEATIAWGESNRDNIALDITTIPDSDLVELVYEK